MRLSELILKLQEIKNNANGNPEVRYKDAEMDDYVLVNDVLLHKNIFGSGVDEVIIK